MKLRKSDRQQKVLEEFRTSPSTRLGKLADRYGVAKETIRRDIDELSAQGLLARTYGGAVAASMNEEPVLRERELVNPEGRRRMADAAVELVADCSIVIIDAGATMSHVCERLALSVPRSGTIALTVITNSLRNAAALGANPSIRVIVCPGDYDDGESAAFGPLTIEFLGRFRADALLMSAGGISADSVTDANSDAVAVKRAMLRQVNRSILLVEKRKFDVPQFETVCSLSEIDDLVTDEPVSAGFDGTGALRVHVAAPARGRS